MGRLGELGKLGWLGVQGQGQGPSRAGGGGAAAGRRTRVFVMPLRCHRLPMALAAVPRACCSGCALKPPALGPPLLRWAAPLP
jgi:hypothetical protein